jgi:hypothetical protein
MRAAVLVLLLAGSAEALDVSIEPYQEAQRAGAVGVVAGRAVAEPRTLRTPAQPLTGTTVRLLPRSEALMTRLERLREASRDSSTAFAAAAPAMRRAHEVYERELLEAGAPDLTPMVLVDQDGAFRIDDLPAGAWVLVAWHSAPVDVSTSKKSTSKKLETGKRSPYRPQSKLQGYQAVTIWLRELTVAGGATVTVELTDRNGWFRGVIEERVQDTSR